MYEIDLARIHEEGFGDFIEGAGPGLLTLIADVASPGETVVDLGCGDGRWACRLTDAGYRVVGIDTSAALVGRAREAAPEAEIRLGSWTDVELPRAAAAVTALGEVLSYVASDESPAPLEASVLQARLRRLAAALRPGGLLVFDVMVEGDGEPMAYRSWRAGDDWAVLLEVSEDPRTALLTREITTFVRAGADYRRGRERHLLRVFPVSKMTAALEAAGFEVRTSRFHGSLELAPRRLAFIARRRDEP